MRKRGGRRERENIVGEGGRWMVRKGGGRRERDIVGEGGGGRE